MNFKSNHSSPVLTYSVPANNSRLGLTSNIAPCSSAPTYSSSGLFLTIPRRKAMPSKIDDVRATAWLDAMLSSSPPRKKLNKDFMYESSFDECDDTYMTWVVNYPSALLAFEQIFNHSKGKKTVLFLDYDGTLSPIVDNPDRAFMSSAMRSAVKNVAKHVPTAIISGRSRDKVYEFVQLPEIHYAGSHGMDIMGPLRASFSLDDHPGCIKTTDKQGKDVHLFQPASEFIPIINEVFFSLVEITRDIIGVKVENNKFCVSIHYHLLDGKNLPKLAQCVGEFLKDYPSLRVTHGRKVLEVRPVIDWNKGKAVEFLLESLGFSNSDDVLPIYVGDDKTDEDAFKVLREGNHGFGILVSSVPKETNPFYSLRDTTQVMEFLTMLVKWKKSIEANYTTALI